MSIHTSVRPGGFRPTEWGKKLAGPKLDVHVSTYKLHHLTSEPQLSPFLNQILRYQMEVSARSLIKVTKETGWKLHPSQLANISLWIRSMCPPGCTQRWTTSVVSYEESPPHPRVGAEPSGTLLQEASLRMEGLSWACLVLLPNCRWGHGESREWHSNEIFSA